MHAKLLPPVQLAGLALLTWSVALVACPEGQIAARGQALNGCVGGSGYTSPPASVKVKWPVDLTVEPTVMEVSTSGPVGDLAPSVHTAFPEPEDYMSGEIDLLIHEEANHTPDINDSEKPPDGSWDPLCGDPDPSLPDAPPMIYGDFFWPTTVEHNGNYDITATLKYTSATDPEDPSTYTTSIITVEITVDVENLLITSTTPANPAPILWDPNSPTSVNLSCNITAAYKNNDTITLSIFDSMQNLVWQQQQTVPIGGLTGGGSSGGGSCGSGSCGSGSSGSGISTDTVSFAWDGTNNQTDEYGSGSGCGSGSGSGAGIGCYPSSGSGCGSGACCGFGCPPSPPGGGTYCPRGVYIFKFEVTNNSIYYTDYDTDKSAYLSVVENGSTTFVNAAPGSFAASVSYTLASTDGNPASSGSIVLYNPDLNQDATQSLTGSQLALGNVSAQVTDTQTSVAGPSYVFLMDAWDNGQSEDKGGRIRLALQQNQRVAPPVFQIYGVKDFTDTTVTNDWNNWIKGGIYQNGVTTGAPSAQVTNQTSPGIPPFWSIPKAKNNVSLPRIGCKALDGWYGFWWSRYYGNTVWYFNGHGDDRFPGQALVFGNTLLVSDRNLIGQKGFPPKGFTCRFLTDLTNTKFVPAPPVNVSLVVMAACQSGGTVVQNTGSTANVEGAGGTQTLTQVLHLGLNIPDVIGFSVDVPNKVAACWTNLFWQYYTQGPTPGTLQSGLDAYTAAHNAQQATAAAVTASPNSYGISQDQTTFINDPWVTDNGNLIPN